MELTAVLERLKESKGKPEINSNELYQSSEKKLRKNKSRSGKKNIRNRKRHNLKN